MEREQIQGELKTYQEKVEDLTNKLYQMQVEEREQMQVIIDKKDQTLEKLDKLIGNEIKRPDTLKGLVQYEVGEVEPEVELAFIKQATLELALVVRDLVQLVQ